MSAAKEIRTKIGSIRNTQKITRAMEMVAASKMRRAQERMRQARPYSDKIREVSAHIQRGTLEYQHPYAQAREDIARVGVIVVTTDKGLCGGLNANTLRRVVARQQEWKRQGVKVCYTVFGNKGSALLNRIGADVISQATGLGDRPSLEAMLGPIGVMTDAFRNGEVDEVWLSYARFFITMKQDAVFVRLLPMDPEFHVDPDADAVALRASTWDYIYEPEAQEVLDYLMTRYIETVIFQANADNSASEQAARMVAMKSASENAGNIIDELQLVYNKSRQAAITKELSEIVGGAAAV